MKHVRKGFTLVELLIVIAILGALSATMSVSTSGATAKAKAAAIAANVEACKSAALMFVNDESKTVTGTTANAMLSDMLPTWTDFSDSTATTGTKYTAAGDTSDAWTVTVDFSNEADAANIRLELQKIKGYNKYNKATTTTENGTTTTNYSSEVIMAEGSYKFKVTLLTGKVEPAS